MINKNTIWLTLGIWNIFMVPMFLFLMIYSGEFASGILALIKCFIAAICIEQYRIGIK